MNTLCCVNEFLIFIGLNEVKFGILNKLIDYIENKLFLIEIATVILS